MAKQKIVLAYSGGLDTSIILTWLKEQYDCEVIAVCCNAGQKEDFKEIEEKAYKTGAAKAYILDIPIHQTVEKIYSRDENIWHISHEGGNLENPWNEHLKDIHVLSCEPEDAPDEVTYVDIDFEQGVPVGLNGEKMDAVSLLNKLNELGSKNGIGTIDIIENRLVGMKSRGVYETPGGTILYAAHTDLERLILDRDTMQYKNIVAQKFAQMIYDGLWFTPLRNAISAFVDVTQENVTGTVRMKLYKGNALPVASKSDYSLYSEEFATFSADEIYNQHDAEGFINLFSLPHTQLFPA